MDPITTSSDQSTSPAAERIRVALNLEAVALSKIPENTVEKLAEICETKLCRFPRKLISISDASKTWGGTYHLSSYHFCINAKMTHDETVQVFVHEFGHAIHSGRLSRESVTYDECLEIFSKQLEFEKKQTKRMYW